MLKLMLVISILVLAPLIFMSSVYYNHSETIDKNMAEKIVFHSDETIDFIEQNVDYIATNQVEEKAKDVAKQLDLFLRYNKMTIDELRKSQEFRDIAISKIGQESYTTVTDSTRLFNIVHPNKEIEGIDLSTISEKLPEFWEIIEKSKNGIISEGVYNWSDNGLIRRKYMYIFPVPTPSADGVFMSVAATIYFDELYGPFNQAKDKIIIERDGVIKSIEESVRLLNTQLLIVIFSSLIFALIVSLSFANTITKPLEELAINSENLLKDMEKSNFVKVKKSSDEINKLADNLLELHNKIKGYECKKNKRKK